MTRPQRSFKRGDLVWIAQSPRAPRLVVEPRLALVVTRSEVNERFGSVVVAGVSRSRGNPFEVPLDTEGKLGVVVCHHLREFQLDRYEIKFADTVPPQVLSRVLGLLMALLGP